MDQGGNEENGGRRPKMVDIFAMLLVFALVATRRRKIKPVHEGGGSSSPPLPLQP